VGTDFSARAVEYTGREAARLGLDGVVELLEREAADFEGIEEGAFDLVILNSVAQYFPSADYLVEVLEGAVRATAPGGAVFVGDVRSLPLLEPFHASIEVYQARDEERVERVAARIARRSELEKELVVDPALFVEAARRSERVTGIELLHKRGWARNELTKYRYTAVLEVGGASRRRVAWGDWDRDGLAMASIEELLRENQREELFIANLPNARVAEDLAAHRLLERGTASTAGQLRRQARMECAGETWVDPEALCSMAEAHGYQTRLGWSARGGEGRFDVAISRAGVENVGFELGTANEGAGRSWRQYTNDPVRGQVRRSLGLDVRAHLRQLLPEYMIPAAVIVVDELPLTSRGKVDRRALPEVEGERPELGVGYAAPETETQEAVARIWQEVLGVGRVGREDDFFELGGHSLLATQVISRVRSVLGVELPLREMFEAPTVALLAARIDLSKSQHPAESAPKSIVRASRASRRVKISSLRGQADD
jgi:hypothetical protein